MIKRIVIALFFAFSLTQTVFAQDVEDQNLAQQDYVRSVYDAAILQINAAKSEIDSLQKKLNKDLAYRKDILDGIKSEIAGSESILKYSKSSREDIEVVYENVVQSWRLLSNYSFDFFADKKALKLEYELNDVAEDLRNTQFFDKYISAKNALNKKYQNFAETKKEFVEINQNQQSKLLLRLGYLRSLALEKGVQIDNDKLYFNDLLIELKLIKYQPLMYVYVKTLDYKELINQVFSGILQILKQIFLIFIAFVILATTKKILRKCTSMIREMQKTLLEEESYSQKKSFVSVAISFVNPYLEWIGLILLFWFLSMLVRDGILSEISAIFPYFIYFFSYKIFRIFCSNYITKIIYRYSKGISVNIFDYTPRIRRVSRSVGLYLLISAWFLHLSKSIVLEALVYNLIFNIVVLGFVVLAFFQIAKWKNEILLKAKTLAFAKVSQYLLSSRFYFLLAAPILLLIIIQSFLQKIYQIALKNETIKSIFVHFYSKKLESAAKIAQEKEQISEPSEQYLELFEQKSDFVSGDFIKVESHPCEEIYQILESWNKNLEIKENSMIIYGESGIGKSYTLNWLKQRLLDQNDETLRVINISFKEKITSKEALSDFLLEKLGLEKGGNFEEKIQEFSQKTIMIFDDCHNLFLSQKNGFEAFKSFLEIINLNENIFFLASFNRYSWNYLQSSLNASQYFYYQFRLPRWTDFDIKNLILRNHKKSGLRLVYDSFIFDIGGVSSRKEFDVIEQKFFQMIWSRSRGNPRTAIAIWLSSLRVLDENSLKITLPKVAKFSNLINLTDEQFFIYAAIMKHQKLSIREICQVAEIHHGSVANHIKSALELNHLQKVQNENRFRLSGSWQIMISKVLINKNFIYE